MSTKVENIGKLQTARAHEAEGRQRFRSREAAASFLQYWGQNACVVDGGGGAKEGKGTR